MPVNSQMMKQAKTENTVYESVKHLRSWTLIKIDHLIPDSERATTQIRLKCLTNES